MPPTNHAELFLSAIPQEDSPKGLTSMPSSKHTRAALLLLTVAPALTLVTGCSTMENFVQGDKLDYRSKASKTSSLEVPPDLTQITRDGRYAPQASGTVSATAFQNSAVTANANASTAAASSVAPVSVGDFRLMKNGNQRWLVTPLAAEKLWPQVRSFWEERGFTLTTDSAEAGVMETSWAENRAKLDDSTFRRVTGGFFNSLYSTGERDKFRIRVERNTSSNGTEIYLTHFGMEEVFNSPTKETTVWAPRANDPQLEAEFLQRLMVKLGAKPDDAKAIVAKATPTSSAARARVLTGQTTTTLQVDENFDRAWRRVGVALDRNGFTVEDRDRTAGTYFVRYADPRNAGKEDPGFFAKIFGGASSTDNAPNRYRVSVKADGERSTVAVFNSQGGPETGEVGQRISNFLLEELR